MSAYILVIDDEPDIRLLVQEILQDEGYEVVVAENAASAREARQARRPDLILLDIWMPDTDGISLLREWTESGQPNPPVIMMSGHGTVETAVEATRHGAYDFLEKPLSLAKLLLTVRHALENTQLVQENIGLKGTNHALAEPIGHSEAMQQLRTQIQRIGGHDTPVLLTGEAGSGKEVCAHYLHQQSTRREGPYIRVAVAGKGSANALTELFGSEAGEEINFGSLEQANGGTVLLSDIADMDDETQLKLLGALQHGSFLRAGGSEAVKVDIRIISATHRDLAMEVKNGRFREDLYYHLNVLPLTVPPLREHAEDIPELLEYNVNLLAAREQLPYRHFSVAAQNRLRHYPWPGNVRELSNIVQRLLILGNGPEIDAAEVDQALGEGNDASINTTSPDLGIPLKEARENFERSYLEQQLREAGGSISEAARRSGLERTHLYRKLRSLGIQRRS